MPSLFDDFDLDVKKVLRPNGNINPKDCNPSGDGHLSQKCDITNTGCCPTMLITKNGACC